MAAAEAIDNGRFASIVADINREQQRQPANSRTLDVEERRTLLLLKAHYPVSDDQAALIFREIFYSLKADFGGRHDALVELLRRNFDASIELQTHLFRRALHNNEAVETAWNNELKGDIADTIKALREEKKIKIAAYRGKDKPIDLSLLPPCSHEYASSSKLVEWTNWKKSCLYMIKTKFAFSSEEAAALMHGIFADSPPCSRPVCDGFAAYLDAVQETRIDKLDEPAWKDPQRDTQTKHPKHRQWWNKVERKITETAEEIGISVTYPSIEPPGSPRVLEQRVISKEEMECWGTEFPYLLWDDAREVADDEDRERIKRGEDVAGAVPCFCSELDDDDDEAEDDEGVSPDTMQNQDKVANSKASSQEERTTAKKLRDQGREGRGTHVSTMGTRPDDSKARKKGMRTKNEGTANIFSNALSRARLQSDTIAEAKQSVNTEDNIQVPRQPPRTLSALPESTTANNRKRRATAAPREEDEIDESEVMVPLKHDARKNSKLL